MKTENVYFPRWTAWFLIIIILPILMLLEYEAFYGNMPYPVFGAVFGLILIIVLAMIFLVSYRKIPYMIIEKQSQTKTKRGREI
ncbi:MAG: hypothetical protein V1678_00940 [Candidatus Aenigmatarchaeota archaeon]